MRHTLIFAFLFAHLASFANDKLDIITIIPSELQPGRSYNVDVIINKGDLTSYAYLEQDLPAGIEAVEAVNDNSDFSFENGKVRFTWMRLPAKQKIKVTYKINVPLDTVGFFDLTGSFSYIIKNQRGQVSLKATRIGIGSRLVLDSLRRVRPLPTSNPFLPQIKVKREEPDYMDFDKSYSIILLIKKDNTKSSLKIEEQLPKGFVPKALKTSGAKFTVKDNVATFEWDSLPSSPYFTVSYLAKGENFTPQMTFDVSGKFTYKHGAKSYSFYIDKNYGKNFKRPSIQELERKKYFSQLDTAKYKLNQNRNDSAQKFFYNNRQMPPDNKQRKKSLKDIKKELNILN